MKNKEELKDLLKTEKLASLEKNKKLINTYKYEIKYFQSKIPTEINPYIQICNTKEEKQLWMALVHLTTSTPYRKSMGRDIKILVRDAKTDYIYGMTCITSDLAQLRLRDQYIGWDSKQKWKKMNNLVNIQTCVPTTPMSVYLTGKMLVYSLFTTEVKDKFLEKYGDDLIGFTTTSLYGKSSMYDRLKQLKYLGLTDGLSAVYISDEEWKNLLKEYNEYFPNNKTKRLAPVKYQIVDKLCQRYKTLGKDFPYTYQKTEYKRGIYFGNTCSNWKEILNGKDEEPKYILPTFKESISNWENRWLSKRIKYVSDNKEKYNLKEEYRLGPIA